MVDEISCSFIEIKDLTKYICVRRILILFTISISNSAARFCDNSILFTFGIKSFCESKSGFPINCLNNPSKAYIQCEPGYYNDKNISLQTVVCMENAQWSEQPIQCKPKCIHSPREIMLMQVEKLYFPTSYVEILEISEESNKFPGLILFERHILTKCEYTMNKEGTSLRIRIPKSQFSWEEHNIFYNFIKREIYNDQELCILYLGPSDYIKFDEITKPNCLGFEIYATTSILTDYRRKRPEYKNVCYPPTLNTEVLCYEQKFESYIQIPHTWYINYVRKPIDCSNGAPYIILRCHLGYQNRKSTTNSFLNKCFLNKWKYETEDINDCENVCGQVINITESESIPLMYKSSPVDVISAPWHVGIYSNSTNDFEQMCGGTMIHSNIVISAGHCFYNLANGEKYPVSNYLVGSGKTYRKYDLDEKFQHFARVKEIHTPESYQYNPVRNDIAVLILDHHIEYTSHIKPICIEWKPYNEYHIQNGIIGRVFGWGSTSLDDKPSGKLQTIEVLTVTNTLCKTMVHPNQRIEITGDKFCATNYRNSTACRGDSGGGMVIKKGYGNEGKYYLLGVISTGINFNKYCSDGFMTTFTNIQFFQDFIKSVILNSREND